jgi:hypothetical protein
MSKYNWTKLFSIRGGHKYFRDEITKKIALADNSGSTPDRTDDGVLWLDTSRCVCIATDSTHRTWISIPVLKEHAETGWMDKSCTPASTKEAIEVVAQFGMKLALQGERFVMIRAESEVAEQGRNEHDADQHNDVQA